MELKEKILKTVFEAVELIETKYLTDDKIQMIIGGVAMGVECVLENIENGKAYCIIQIEAFQL